MQHLSVMDRARHALEKGERFPAGALPALVAESWQRCRDAGLDPGRTPRQSVLPFGEVRRRREDNAAMRRLALAEMQLLHSQIAGSSFMIALGDADGIVLDTISDQHFADSAAGRSIIPGSMWKEAERGTNALGLAAATQGPVAIYGREHYFSCHGHLSCMAAPIFNSRGEILGLIDASCANEARQEHTHALVRMAAAQIENGLVFHECANSFVFAFHPRVEYLDTLSAGLISVCADGHVGSINRPGKALLAGLAAETDCHFDTLFNSRFTAAMDGLLKGGVIRIRDMAGSGVFMVCRQIGQSLGAPRKPVETPPPKLMRVDSEPDFICHDPVLQQALKDIADAVALQMPVHVTGETGTGKELMARHVHRASGRKGEFVAVNCGAIPEELFIAEMFGHERGAFTNARNDGAPGLARTAHRGTLFLDEVADIPLAAQASLLRFLDSMEVRSVGGQKIERVDVQIVSATNGSLEALVAQRAFRADLYYRLNAFSIRLPPLRHRTDMAAIIRHLIDAMAPDTPVTDAAIAALSRQKWPGNIRELRSVLQRALVRRRTDYVDEDCFESAPPATIPADCCVECADRPLNRARCEEIRSAYRSAGANVAQTARALGLSRTTVYKHVGSPGTQR